MTVANKKKFLVEDTEGLAKRLRKTVLEMVFKAKAPHAGSNLSLADILAVLYGKAANIDPHDLKMPGRDRVIVSKGHAAAIVYAVLSECGFLNKKSLSTYCENGSILTGHISHYVPGVELSTGSLGHGLSVGLGLALAGKRDSLAYKVYVVLSDGELDEGSVWEAILFAPHNNLDNLVAIIDYNKIQGFGRVKDVLDIEPLADKLKACNWAVREVNGHDHRELAAAFRDLPFVSGKPSVIIAHTVKGKGISFMENKLEWHYKCPTEDQVKLALSELDQV